METVRVKNCLLMGLVGISTGANQIQDLLKICYSLAIGRASVSITRDY